MDNHFKAIEKKPRLTERFYDFFDSNCCFLMGLNSLLNIAFTIICFVFLFALAFLV